MILFWTSQLNLTYSLVLNPPSPPTTGFIFLQFERERGKVAWG